MEERVDRIQWGWYKGVAIGWVLERKCVNKAIITTEGSVGTKQQNKEKYYGYEGSVEE